MSSRLPSVSSRIEKLPGLVHRHDEVSVPGRGAHDQIDQPSEEGRQCVPQLEIARNPRAEFVILGILDDEVDIARFRVELVGADRAENLELQDPILLGEAANALQVVGDERVYGVRP